MEEQINVSFQLSSNFMIKCDKGATASMQIHRCLQLRCVMKFCQTDKISLSTCMFADEILLPYLSGYKMGFLSL